MANAVAFFARMDAFIHWRGGGCGNNGGGNVLALAACKSWQWTARREREEGGGGCSDEAVAMLPRGGRAADNTMRGVGAEGAARGELKADDLTRGGGQTTRGKRAADDRTIQQEGGGARRSWRRRQQWRRRQRWRQLVIEGRACTTVDAGNGSAGDGARPGGS